MSAELRKAFADLGKGLAAAMAALPKAAPPQLPRMAELPRHYPSARCTVYDCRIPEHYVGGVVPGEVRPRVHAMRTALQAVLDVLDGRIERAQDNHHDSYHPNEPQGQECWRRFSPGDIRNMINDAARAVGLTEFPPPNVRKEDAL